MSDEPFISRWARRKAESGAKAEPSPVEPPPAPQAAPAATSIPAPEPLPPVESLTPQSDFAAFMKPHVDEALKRRAVKTLFQDPRFNVMDGLDVYIDDYSLPDPLPPSWLGKLNQLARMDAHKAPEARPEATAAGDTTVPDTETPISPQHVGESPTSVEAGNPSPEVDSAENGSSDSRRVSGINSTETKRP